MKYSKSIVAVAGVTAIALASCNPLSKMAKRLEEVKYTVNPNPVEMHSDTVAISIKGTYPANFFHKKVTVKVTPVLNMGEGQTKELKPVTLVGESVEAEGKKIEFEKGGSFTYDEVLPYAEGMEKMTLELKADASFKTKEKAFGQTKIGDGTIITPYLVQADDKAILGKDQFVKIIPRQAQAEIHFPIQSAQVRGSELKDADIAELVKFIKEGKQNGLVFKSASISAYASPDGEIDKNENLATDRAKAAASYLKGQLKKAGIDIEIETVGKGEDWDGFKKATEASDIQDKNLIIKVLQMTSDLDKREQEIKNMAATYTELAEEILPQLRRAIITLNAEETARTDEEITRLVTAAPDSLSVEEILYAATLNDDLSAKLSIYNTAAKVYPKDWRGANNAGYIQIAQNDLAAAKGNFVKADGIDAKNAVVQNNLAICERIGGDRVKAQELLNAAAGAGPEVSYNQGIIDIQNGEYASAVGNLGGKSFNGALAKLLSGDPDGALKIVDQSADKTSAEGYYLKAVAGARKKQKDLVINNLKSAIEKDGSLKAKAGMDAEFIEFRDDSDFTSLVQ